MQYNQASLIDIDFRQTTDSLLVDLLTKVPPRGLVEVERNRIEEKYKDMMHEELNLGSLVSYVGNKKIPFLRLYRYKEAFSFEFVRRFLKRLNIGPKDYILDPFCGMGTTLFTSSIYQIPSIGIDKLPIAAFVSKTLPLFFSLKNGELRNRWNSLSQSVEGSEPAILALDVSIMKIAFNSETLLRLRKLKSTIDKLETPYQDLFLLLFFSILEDCSFTSKDGQFLRLSRSKVIHDPMEAMERKVEQAEDDIKRISVLFPDLKIKTEVLPKVLLEDTRDVSSVEFKTKPTLIITSPPYVNRYDYTRTYCLELCFNFVKDFEKLKEIRFGILRSHIESRADKQDTIFHPAIGEIVNCLKEKDLNNPRIPIMLIAYFVDLRKAIKEWFKVLAPGGRVVMVVDNVRFEGEMVPVDLILSDIAEEAGFKVKEIVVARYKGNSSQQMKKYGKIPVRESIIIWEKNHVK